MPGSPCDNLQGYCDVFHVCRRVDMAGPLLRLKQKFFTVEGTTCLTNRFHVAVHLFSNRSQVTPKCGKNKKMAREPSGECVTDVLTTF